MRAGSITLGAAIVAFGLGTGQASGETRPLPTKPEIARQTVTAVAASHAGVVRLRVVPPNRLYALTVKVADLAAYLKYRADRLVNVMNRLTNVERRFQTRYFAVLDRSGRRVLWLSQHRGTGVEVRDDRQGRTRLLPTSGHVRAHVPRQTTVDRTLPLAREARALGPWLRVARRSFA